MSSASVEGDIVTPTNHSINRNEMFQTFQSWALQNYGDSGKTKTVTEKKYNRIVRILTGEEPSSAENSKFRFWVKAKGFRLGPFDGLDKIHGLTETLLYVPTKQVTDSNSNDTDRGYKRVAIVEDFFEIIYGVHVEMDGRGGKHAGQKRTYRAIAETYAFLPREAVTRFLMSCSDCQKRMHLGTENTAPVEEIHTNGIPNNNEKDFLNTSPIIDYNVPITQTYLNQMRNRGYFSEFNFNDDESMSSGDSIVSGDQSPSPTTEDTNGNHAPVLKTESACENGEGLIPVNLSTPRGLRMTDSPLEDERALPIGMISKSPIPSTGGHPERKRRASDDSCESSTKASEGGTVDDLQGSKDDDDDDDMDDDEKLMSTGKEYDPERLKSFNMFVRLFVDENLDRMVPISKQPKDKVQAILEACDRQFPEFHERSRKRIRTYLKSCRRMRRSKEQNGWEPIRPTPPHLTSATAESYLAQACENESQNAKRMRMGLEPLPVRTPDRHISAGSMPSTISTTNQSTAQPPVVQPTAAQPQPPQQATPSPHSQPPSQPPSRASPQATPVSQIDRHPPSTNDFMRHQPPPAFRPPPEFHPPFFTNGNGIFRPGFPPGYQHPAHHHPPVLQHSPIAPTSVQNGPTDLSMKKQASKNQLSTSEVATIKQLIAGYRESAAFLYRSADELEQLLLQQN
ncbi:nucleolar protein 4-like isoform X2 [Argopecten irradians]|uniref:nucleolar protein 4-like isoform X2 n=1 Tax=Argopecten irradians TaxID=31199 RepID=UPI0037136D88